MNIVALSYIFGAILAANACIIIVLPNEKTSTEENIITSSPTNPPNTTMSPSTSNATISTKSTNSTTTTTTQTTSTGPTSATTTITTQTTSTGTTSATTTTTTQTTSTASTSSVKTTQQVEVWLSDPLQSKMLNKEPSVNFQTSSVTSSQYTININESIKYQTMDGFGASLTDASCWLFKYKLSDAKRDELLKAIFGQDGIGLSILRQPIGASDFSWEAWTFADSSYDDWTLSSFALWREDDYIFPILSKAMGIQPGRIKLFGSPWSPPAWMRKNNHLFGSKGGYLRPECYDVYGNYFVKYVQGYAARGLPVYAVSLQNEPLYAPEHYPGMTMSIQDQIGFIKDYLGPKFTLGGIKTKIIAYDHNYDQAGLDYSRAILNDQGANRYCSGIGFHTYTWPQHFNMDNLHREFPNKDIWITEAGSGTWIGSDVNQFSDQMMHMIRSPRNWAKGVVFWNVALDQNSSPKLANVDSSNSNRGLVTIRSDTNDQWKYEMGYYSMGHSSKFVNPGAQRIFSDNYQDKVETVAYLNQDNSIVLVMSNREANQKQIQVKWSQKTVDYTMPAHSALTFKWYI